MTTLVDKNTRLAVQGITGKAASLHTRIMREYGTQVVAGVRPGAAGRTVEEVPVYDTIADAVKASGANASTLFVPAYAIREAAFEALDAGIELLVMVPEHVPLHDTMAIVERATATGARVVGPNTPGLICPAANCKIGFLPQRYFEDGPVGVASRSGTLTYEIVSRLSGAGMGQSTCVGVGGDPIVCTTFAQMLQSFEADDATSAIVLVGEIGGSMEEDAAELVVQKQVTKPVVAFLAGRNAPKDKRMGHAGAIVAAGRGSIESKLEAFEKAGIAVADQPADVVPLVKRALGR
ncbi:MAG: succinate--CoA ligase subunit alpha [Deltaproteobacteria bacterium]|nr:succinate--CoA ligase subunit alpha [Deltaproteobacteria bacterium]